MPETVTLSESALWLAEQAPTGFLVALWLDPDVAAQLAVADGEPADALHVTLAYCGDAADLGDLATMRAVAAVERDVKWRAPIEGKVAGYGRFIASDSSDGQDVFYASVDVPGLAELRQCVVNCLMDAGVPPSTEHGYTPHLTLAYLDSGAKNPVDSLPPLELAFSGVTVMIGTKRVDIPFAPEGSGYGVMSMAAADETLPPNAPLGIELARPLLFEATQEWIAYLPVPGKYHHSVFDLNLTAEKYDRLVSNFKANVYGQDLPVNIEHDFRAAGAVGWIRDMRIAADGSIEVKPEWNDRGKALLEGDRFRYVSAEWGDRWQDPVTGEFHADVPMGLAITTHPHLKPNVLKPLAMSEEVALVSFSTAGETGKEPNMVDEPKDTQTDVTTVPPAVAPPQRAAHELSLSEVVLTAAQRQQERESFRLLTERVDLAEQRAKTAETALASEKRDRLEEWAKAEVMGRSAENGTAWLGPIQDNVEWLLSEAVTYGRDSDNVRRLLRDKRAMAAVFDESDLTRPLSVGASEKGGDVLTQVRILAEQKRQANPQLTIEAAESQVYSEKPELYVRVLNAKK